MLASFRRVVVPSLGFIVSYSYNDMDKETVILIIVPFLQLCKMITLPVCLGNLLSVCRESGALWRDWFGRELLQRAAGKEQSRSGQILSILPTPYRTDTHTYTHTDTHPHKHTPPSGRRGGGLPIVLS